MLRQGQGKRAYLKRAAGSRLRKARRAGGSSRNCEEKVQLKRLSRMPEGKRAGNLTQEVAGVKVVKQRGTAPSGDKLGGPVRPSERLAQATQREQGW